MKKTVITIARSYGSGGRTLGKLLAEELGINCYDREILRMASDDSGINEALFGQTDEKLKKSPLFRIARKNPYKGGVIPLEQFARMQYDRDLLVRVIVKKKPGVFSYQAMRVQKTDFPILTCGVSRMDGVCKAVIGARPGKAVCIHDDRHLLDGEVTEKKAEAFAEYVAEQVTTGSNMRGSAEYRTHLVKILTGRGVMELGGVRA